MKRILVALLVMTSALTSFGYVYPNFMESGKYAYADKEYALAKYFFEKALDDVPSDSVVESYIIHNRLRDINKADKYKYTYFLITLTAKRPVLCLAVSAVYGIRLSPSHRTSHFPSLGNPGLSSSQPSQPAHIMAMAVNSPPFPGR